MYGSLESLDFIRDCLDELSVKSKYDSIDESNPMQVPPPTFLILAKNPNNDDTIHKLRKEGQELSSRYEFILQHKLQKCGCFSDEHSLLSHTHWQAYPLN